MKRNRFFQYVQLIFSLFLLVLSACAPAATPSPPSPTVTATSTLQPSPTRAAEESTQTAALATASPTPPPARDLLAFDVVTQMGGTFGPLAIDGDTVYLGIGPRLAVVDISDPAAPRLLWQSETLPGLVESLAVHPGRVYLRVGSDLLVYDTGDPALPVQAGRFPGVFGELVAAGDFVYAFTSGGDPGLLIAIDVRDPANPVEVSRLDGCLQVVMVPTRWNLAVVRGEEIGAQLVLVLEAPPITLVVVGVAAAPQTRDVVDVRPGIALDFAGRRL